MGPRGCDPDGSEANMGRGAGFDNSACEINRSCANPGNFARLTIARLMMIRLTMACPPRGATGLSKSFT